MTDREVDLYDNKTVVCWKAIGQEVTTIAYTYSRRNSSTYEILATDICFNYYMNWDVHGQVGSDEYCIRNTAAHEWGHFAGLRHVYYNPDYDDSRWNCPLYVDYTMYNQSGTNEHNKEYIKCEDKYALKLHYEIYLGEE